MLSELLLEAQEHIRILDQTFLDGSPGAVGAAEFSKAILNQVFGLRY